MRASTKNRKDRQPSGEAGRWQKEGLFVLLLMVALVAAYWPALHGNFLWDDDDHISNNKTLQSLRGLWEIWFKPGATCQYYPLSFTVFWAGYHLWGLNTVGYHLLNVLLHGVVSVLLWQVLKRLRVPGAWLAGAIFALHPVCVMSVAWMTELKNTLSGSLALGAIWGYVRFAGLGVYAASGRKDEGPEWRYYVLSLGLFLLAMFAKTAVSFVPISLLLVVWWQRDRIRWSDVWPLIPMMAIAVLMGQLTISVEHHSGGATGKVFSLSLLERVLISGRSFWFYLGKLFFPYRLTFIYERWPIDTRAWWSYLYPAATLGLLAGLWGMRKRIGKGALAAMLHFYVTSSMLILVVVLYMTQYTWVTDHWQYFGCMGVLALAAAGITKLLEGFDKQGRLLAPTLCGALLLVLGVLTWRQTRVYTDIETLWRATIANNPDCWMAHSNLGLALLQRGQLDEAVAHLQKSLEIEPNNSSAQNNLGNALLRKGQLDEAIVQFQKTLKIDPDNPDAHGNLGNVFLQKGRLAEAIAHFQKTVEVQPQNPIAHNGLAVALIQSGRVDEAIAEFRKTLEFDPANADAQGNLGLALFQMGRLDEAIDHYQKYLELVPNDASILNRLAWVLATCPEASIRNGARAVELAQRADGLLGGRNPLILTTLAAAEAETGRFPEAVATARQALQLLNAQANANTGLVNALRAQIGLYEAGSPFRDTSLRNAPQSQGRP
jgi:Flp pilus assembly protein TadD